VDGTARVWDCDSGAKVLEVHADASTRTRATRAVIAPDGTKVCIGCGDGGVGVVGVGGGGGGAAPGVQGPVRHAKAHPSGAAVVHAVFLNHGPLLTVAADGSVAVTNVANGAFLFYFPYGQLD
jgi:WD40 repeat protein